MSGSSSSACTVFLPLAAKSKLNVYLPKSVPRPQRALLDANLMVGVLTWLTTLSFSSSCSALACPGQVKPSLQLAMQGTGRRACFYVSAAGSSLMVEAVTFGPSHLSRLWRCS